MMTLSIQLPAQIEEQLRAMFGARLDQEAKEALAIELYREAKISIGQLAEILGLAVVEADAWLADRGIEIPMTVEELRAELQGSQKQLERQ